MVNYTIVHIRNYHIQHIVHISNNPIVHIKKNILRDQETEETMTCFIGQSRQHENTR